MTRQVHIQQSATTSHIHISVQIHTGSVFTLQEGEVILANSIKQQLKGEMVSAQTSAFHLHASVHISPKARVNGTGRCYKNTIVKNIESFPRFWLRWIKRGLRDNYQFKHGLRSCCPDIFPKHRSFLSRINLMEYCLRSSDAPVKRAEQNGKAQSTGMYLFSSTSIRQA